MNFKALFPAHFTLILLWSSRPPATFASISLIFTQQSTTIIVIVKQLHSITLPYRWLTICYNASKRSQAVWCVLFDKFLGSFNVMKYLAVFFFAQIYYLSLCRIIWQYYTLSYKKKKKKFYGTFCSCFDRYFNHFFMHECCHLTLFMFWPLCFIWLNLFADSKWSFLRDSIWFLFWDWKSHMGCVIS